jgi:hypothetical protein
MSATYVLLWEFNPTMLECGLIQVATKLDIYSFNNELLWKLAPPVKKWGLPDGWSPFVCKASWVSCHGKKRELWSLLLDR